MIANSIIKPKVVSIIDTTDTKETEEASIDSIEFHLLSAEDVKKISVAEIKESKLKGEGSVYDARLGVIQNHSLCVTCNKNNQECPGHYGHIELSIPVVHPMYHEEVLMYLNNFCSECSSLLITNNELKVLNKHELRGDARKREVINLINKVGNCPSCNFQKCKYYLIDFKFYKYIKDKKEKIPVSSLEIEEILGKIKDKDVKNLGYPSSIKPVNLIINNLLVIPTCARPFIETAKGPCDDDLTNKYIEIIKICNKLKNKTLKETEKKDVVDSLEFHIHTLMHNYKHKARQINNRPIKCIRERLNGKTGLFRQNLSGKRGDFTARTVIGPDPRLRADEIAIPEEFAKKLSFPERVNKLNKDYLEKLVNDGKANTIKRNDIRYCIDIMLNTRSTYEKRYPLVSGDIVIRDNKKIDIDKYREKFSKDFIVKPTDTLVRNKLIRKDIKLVERVPFTIESQDRVYRDGKVIFPYFAKSFNLEKGDEYIRDGVELKNIILSQKKKIELKDGDIVERHLKNGDIVLFGRQPTLHKGSMIARKIKVFPNKSGINGHRPIRTIRMNLAQNKTYNADFDGDEMNLYIPQSYEAVAELQELSSTKALVKSSQSSRLLLCITQDALTAGYIFTAGEYRYVDGIKTFSPFIYIDKETFNDALCVVDTWSIEYIMNKREHIKKVLKLKGEDEKYIEEFIYTGHGLVSMLLPNDFEYSFMPSNIVITRGVMLSGFLSKPSLSDSHSSIVHKLEKEYGSDITIDFVSNYQFVINHCLKCRGFSIGIEDCLPTKVKDVGNEITKSFLEAQNVENSENDLVLREKKINNVLNNATAVGQKMCKDVLEFDNALNVMVMSGSKGSYVNIAQIRGLLGQQNVEGKRMPTNFGGRTLPHYSLDKIDTSTLTPEQEDYERKLIYEGKGFVSSCFMRGLNPQEFFFHAEGGREGVIDTAIKTAQSGYIQRKLVKKMEDLVKSYSDGLVVNSKNNVIQFNYENNFDPARLVRTGEKMSFINIKNVVNKLNSDKEWNDSIKEKEDV